MAGEAMPDDITPSQYDSSFRFRVKRLLRSFIKFHEGSLDLSGRSERRYCSLKDRVSAFVRDVELVERHATRYETEVEDFPPGTYYTVAYYNVEPAHILADFEAKYRLSCVGNSLGAIFQDAARSLILGDDSFLLDDDLDADITQYRERFQTEVNFLQSRTDIMQRIDSLVIYSSWGVGSLEKVGLEPGSPTHGEFFAPVERGIARVLDGSFNLRRLRMANLGITGSMIWAISSMRSLSFLVL
ncbi:hypothetical protein WOLCODRAFT_137832, partial [Wolfiporia cocos MD-104 SS10]